MCYSCGEKVSVSYNKSLHELFNDANSYGGASASAAVGRYKEILSVLQANGGCGSCIGMIENKIRTTF